MRFLIDAQLPPALARLLAAKGHIAEHAFDIGPEDASDRQLWNYAILHQAVIVTKDEDFSDMVAAIVPAPVVIWVRVGNVSRDALLKWFEPQLPRVIDMVEAGQAIIVLRQLYVADAKHMN